FPAKLRAIAPTALARANDRARCESVDRASHTLVAVAAYASIVAGSSGASPVGHPATMASPRSPANDDTAAAVAETTRPNTTQPSRRVPLAASGTLIVQFGIRQLAGFFSIVALPPLPTQQRG